MYCTMYMYVHTYRVILRIVRAGCHLVAIAQVIEHRQLKSEAPGSIPSGCWFSKNIYEPFLHVYVHVHVYVLPLSFPLHRPTLMSMVSFFPTKLTLPLTREREYSQQTLTPDHMTVT